MYIDFLIFEGITFIYINDISYIFIYIKVYIEYIQNNLII